MLIKPAARVRGLKTLPAQGGDHMRAPKASSLEPLSVASSSAVSAAVLSGEWVPTWH